jgi:hypothetical protein
MECLLLAAGERSDKAIVDNWERRRMVKGDGRPGRGRCLAEEDDDEYYSRMALTLNTNHDQDRNITIPHPIFSTCRLADPF